MDLELIVLGTASQAPTRDRSQGGYVVRWGDAFVLFDPGEGCQRQLLRAGLSAAKITHVFISHFHGDHVLGLPGLVQSRALAGERPPLELVYDKDSAGFVDHLLAGTEVDFDLNLRRRPIAAGASLTSSPFTIRCAALDHTVPTLGWRLEAGPGRHLVADRLAAAGVHGSAVGVLAREGWIATDDGPVLCDDLSEVTPGAVVAYLMDTRETQAAVALAHDADLAIIEATYLDADEALAEPRGHLTAARAARIARRAGARHLVLGHYSNRYEAVEDFAAEAQAIFPGAIAARDLARYTIPGR